MKTTSLSDKPLHIGVIFPSRGLLFTDTLKELLDELQGIQHKLYWSHGNSLPNCFNIPLTKALKGSHTHILIVEDDMVLSKGILRELLEADEDIIACDYPINLEPSGTVLYDTGGKAIFTGTGFMLIKRRVFNDLPTPVFRADISWQYKPHNTKLKFEAQEADPNKVYGQHDITFGLYNYLRGKPITVAKTVLKQRKLKAKGTNASNSGADEIVITEKHKKIPLYILPGGTDKSILVEIEIDGKRMNVRSEHAKELLGQGKATTPVHIVGDVVVDPNGIKKVIKLLKGVR